MIKSQKGFTLIELLIVIVIIGILAGVLIAIINPGEQQNRARDANVKATLNKIALATEGYISAYGEVPDDVNFAGSLDNATAADSTTAWTYGDSRDCDTSDFECVFTISGNNLPTTSAALGAGTQACDATEWRGAANTNNCFYRYWGEDPSVANTDPTHFRLYARSFGLTNTVFMYDNKAAGISDCDASGANIVDDITVNAGLDLSDIPGGSACN